jgi:hypothetical protein
MAIWDRLAADGESARAYRSFTIYRDLGPQRSMPAAWRVYRAEVSPGHKPGVAGVRCPGYILKWATRFLWTKRAQAWDDYQDQCQREARLKARLRAIEEMDERQVQRALLMQELATRWFANLAQKLQADPTLIEQLGATEARRLFLEAAALERIARGEPAQIVQTSAGQGMAQRRLAADLAKLTDDDLERIAASGLGASRLDSEADQEPDDHDGATEPGSP